MYLLLIKYTNIINANNIKVITNKNFDFKKI